MPKSTSTKTTTASKKSTAPVAAVANTVAVTPAPAVAEKRGPGRPPIPTMSIKLSSVSPKGSSFRMDTEKSLVDAGHAAVQSIYLNRVALADAGLKQDHMPTVVEVTFRVLEQKPEPKA